MVQWGTTTLSLLGWLADPRQPEASRQQRLAAIGQLIEGYGLQAVELALDLAAIYPQVFDTSFYAAVASLQQELGFACTVHLPFLWVDASAMNQSIREASVACLRKAVEQVQPIAVRTYVLHLWGFTTTQIARQLAPDGVRQAILEVLIREGERSLAELCELVDPRDVCVENLEDTLFELALPAIERIGASICLDVGHLAWQGSEPVHFLIEHRDRIREIHLHDAAVGFESGQPPVRDHLALGQGHLDYEGFLQALDRIGFEGAVILEVNCQAALEASLTQLGTIRPA